MAVQTQISDRSLDTSAFAAAVASAEENSYTVLSSELLLKGEYYQDGDDLIIRGDMGEEVRVEDYFSGENPPVLETPAGAVLRPETIDHLLINDESIEVAGPAGSIGIPGLLGDPIGAIDEMGGTVTAKGADGRVRELQEGDAIYQNDLVETVGRSYANLRMVDDTSFQLGKETRAIIENYNFTPGVESGQFEATVVSGFFRYASGKLGGLDKGTHTTIKTPTAQIGVRGSEMEGVVEEDGSSTFVHREGILDVSDANGRGTVTLDQPGMATAVSIKPGAPEPAFDAPDELLQVFEEALPPVPDYVVAANEEEQSEAQEEELEASLAPGEGEDTEEELNGEEFELQVELVEEVVEEEVEVVEEERVNLIPKAAGDSQQGMEGGGPITGSLAGDQLGDGAHTWTLSNAPRFGTVTLNPDGSYSYIPNADYEGGTDSFTYTITDADGDSSTGTVSITVTPVNDDPIAVNDTNSALEASSSLVQGDVTDNDIDPDSTLTVTAVRTGAQTEAGSSGTVGTSLIGTYGTLTLNSDGTYTYVADQSAATALNVDAQGIDTFTYTVSDGISTSTAELTITVTGTVDNVPVANNDSNSTTESNPPSSSAITGDVTSNDVDPDSSLTVTAIRTGGVSGSGTAGSVGSSLVGTYGTLTINSDGTYSYIADQSAARALAIGASGIDTFTYTISDGTSTSTAELTITVTGAVNDAPVASDDTGTVTEAATITGSAYNVITNDSDPEGDDLRVSAIRTGAESGSGTDGTVGSALTGTYGTLTIDSYGNYTYVADQAKASALGLNATATDTFTYTVWDGNSTDTAELVITINGTNVAPTLAASVANSTASDGTTALTYVAYHENATTPPAVTLFTDESVSVGAGSGEMDGILYVKLTVSGIATAGSGEELLLLDGLSSGIDLTQSTSVDQIFTSDTLDCKYSVVFDSETSTATVTLKSSDADNGWSSTNYEKVNELIESLQYKNISNIAADQTVGERVVTLTEIADSGGHSTGGTEDVNSSVGVAATIKLLPSVSLDTGVALNEGASSGSQYYQYQEDTDTPLLGGATSFAISLSFIGSKEQSAETGALFSYGSTSAGASELDVLLDPSSSTLTVRQGSTRIVEIAADANLFDGNLHTVTLEWNPSSASGTAILTLDSGTPVSATLSSTLTLTKGGVLTLGELSGSLSQGTYYDVKVDVAGEEKARWTMDSASGSTVTSSTADSSAHVLTVVSSSDTPATQTVTNTLLVNESIDLSTVLTDGVLPTGTAGTIEQLDLRGSSAQTVTLRKEDVISLTDDSNTLYILGDDTDDNVVISDKTNWKKVDLDSSDNSAYAKYMSTDNTVTLYVDLPAEESNLLV